MAKLKILNYIVQKRTFFHLLFPLFCLLYAKPTLSGLLIGICLVFSGEGIRLLSSGYIVKNELLATNGPYAYTRNPLYLGSFIIGLGICFLSGLIYFVLPVYLFLFALLYIPTIKSEEEFLTQKFGNEYLAYKNSVPVFLPVPWRRLTSSRGKFSWSRVRENKEPRNLMLSLLLVSLFALKYLVTII